MADFRVRVHAPEYLRSFAKKRIASCGGRVRGNIWSLEVEGLLGTFFRGLGMLVIMEEVRFGSPSFPSAVVVVGGALTSSSLEGICGGSLLRE